MSCPEPIAEAQIAAHVGKQASSRGRRYEAEQRVSRRAWSPGRLEAVVRGQATAPYEVAIALDSQGTVVASTCACPIGQACKHVAAVLFAHRREPGSFRELAPVTPTRVAPEDWEEWATQHQIEDLLDQPITRVFSTWRLYELPLPRHTPILDLLESARVGSHQQQAALGRAQQVLRDWLEAEAAHRDAARGYQRCAEAWRGEAPGEPWLGALYHSLRQQTHEAPPHLGPTERPAPTQFHCIDDPPALVVQLPSGERSQPIPLEPGAVPPALSADIARTLLDLLTHPELTASDLRAWVSTSARTPIWERALHALDALASASEAVEDADGRKPGWRIERSGGLKLTLVWVRPYKTRQGLRTWTMGHERRQLHDPRDREALAVLAGYGHTRDATTIRALASLVGHPRLVWERGQHVALREGEVGLDWHPEQGGIALVPTVDGEQVDAPALLAALGTVAAERLLWVDEARARLVLCPCPPATYTLLRAVLERASVFPPEAVERLLSRFETLSELAPMRLRGSLRGEQVSPDLRPLVRLTPAPDGSVEIVVRSRVLPDTRPYPPGRGPEEVATVRDGVRVFATRDLARESAAILTALAPLSLPERSDFTWQLDSPESALPVIVALREEQARFQVEWVRPPPRISRAAVASDVRIAAAARRDWFGLEGGVQVEGQEVSLAELLAAVRHRRAFVRLGDGAFLHLSRRLRAQLDDAAARAWEDRGGVAIAPLAIESLAALEQEGAQVELPDTFRIRTERLREAQELKVPVPAALRATLRPYQLEGFRFLARLAHWAPGAVLADDMGLGKTLQSLTLLLHRSHEGPALVVAPASVHTNWLREAQRFAPSLELRSYRGAHRSQHLAALSSGQVLVTSWDLMTRDLEVLGAHRFATLILDEAQAIKNPGTHRARASATLDAAFVVALTGTPVENRVSDLWSLFRTVVPGLLGPGRHFRERFVAPIERDGSSIARAALARMIRPFLLRRLKGEVAPDLPPREDVEVRISLSTPERALYERYRGAAIEALERGREEDRFQILAALTRLRQLACDARLVDPQAGIQRSAKVDRLVHLARDLRDGGHQVLVFSQFTGLLDLARAALEGAQLSVRTLDGSLSLARRQREVDAFQQGDGDVFLISLKAGGLGLNLTAASYVVHLDPWWNPAAEDQATDRAHRIGQSNPVTVYRFIASDTVEEEVVAMHRDKRALVEGLLAGTGRAAPVTAEELRALLGQPITLDAPEPPTSEPTPWDEVLVLRFQALVETELTRGDIAKPTVAQDYRRVVNRLVSFVRSNGGRLRSPEDVRDWGLRYLEALDDGKVAGDRADIRHTEPAFRRLGRLLVESR